MPTPPQTFGSFLRARRLAHGYTLRRFAHDVGLSPTYVSQIEQDQGPPPTAERIRAIATVLKTNPDELLALAGRMTDDVRAIIDAKPREMATVLREVNKLNSEELQKFLEGLRERPRKG
jgi:HTH-type transcriptional regulator, competence development regulator